MVCVWEKSAQTWYLAPKHRSIGTFFNSSSHLLPQIPHLGYDNTTIWGYAKGVTEINQN